MNGHNDGANIDQKVRDFFTAEVPDEVRSRLAAVSDDFRRGNPPKKLKENFIMSVIWKITATRKKWAVSSALAIIVIVFVFASSIGENGSGIVFAEVRDCINMINSLTYTVGRNEGDSPQVSLDRRMAMKPGLWRQEWGHDGSVLIIDNDAGKLLSLWPTEKQYALEDLDEEFAWNVFDFLEELMDPAFEVLPEREIDGVRTQGFRAKLPPGKSPVGCVATIWADVESGNPVRVEYERDNGTSSTFSDFQINVALDESLFSLTPPEGYSQRPPE